ncbi:4'-phosphopantetheinyl transferase family protein [Lentiprolixibacter aurantiacus]|uniref:4'-phosphopantetheinyl transferase superfamily protein n=1 Tax=Lentiprolixibacter aurantiacus TaxID=2993939 RepID=A0AAE3MIF2_9FLAO|nr:4'-phosphopantetheinyl transferase family protein [Lentiprolixibacter aurantiacus]MCX2718265.1 4'-phosphopantetheinyl transferase superfamily protein [Lentiprolixibacter aurantiacus]
MPLYKTLAVRPDIFIYLWKVEEQESVLQAPLTLTENSINRLGGMKSELHRRGFLSIRHLLAEAGYADSDLYYDMLGKPHLKDGNHISITHSHNFTGIIVSEQVKVGIDIEKQRDKIARIAHKFTDLDYDRRSEDNELVRRLTVLWGAKESIYKVLSTPGISFYKHIDIRSFKLNQGKTTGIASFQGEDSHYEIAFLEFEGFTCVYALRA